MRGVASCPFEKLATMYDVCMYLANYFDHVVFMSDAWAVHFQGPIIQLTNNTNL